MARSLCDAQAPYQQCAYSSSIFCFLFGDNGEMAQNYFSWVKNGSQGDKLFFIGEEGYLVYKYLTLVESWMGSLFILSCLLET